MVYKRQSRRNISTLLYSSNPVSLWSRIYVRFYVIGNCIGWSCTGLVMGESTWVGIPFILIFVRTWNFVYGRVISMTNPVGITIPRVAIQFESGTPTPSNAPNCPNARFWVRTIFFRFFHFDESLAPPKLTFRFLFAHPSWCVVQSNGPPLFFLFPTGAPTLLFCHQRLAGRQLGDIFLVGVSWI